jgi:copper resistance protein B
MRLLKSLAVAATLVAVASPAYAHNHDALSSRFRLNNFDWGGSSAGDRFSWDFDARVGTAENRIFFRTEGEVIRGQTEDAEIQLFYNRPISEFWDFNVGWRRDFFPTNRNYAALGLSGIAPNFYEVEATAYLSEQGVAAGRLELSTDLLLAREVFGDSGPGMYLRPKLTTNVQSADDREQGTYAGFTDIRLSLQLRYEFTPRIAPYVEVGWGSLLGRTANEARHDGERTTNSYAVIGIRSLF